MLQKRVGNAPEAAPRLIHTRGDRLVASVSARHHQGTRKLLQQEAVEGCVRQHHPGFGEPGSHRGRKGSSGEPGEEHDRTGRARQEALRLLVQGHELRRIGEGRDHDRQGLRVPPLSSPEPKDRVFVRSRCGEVESSEASEGDDPPTRQETGRFLQCPDSLVAPLPHLEPDPGPTLGTRIGLRVVASVPGVPVLGPASLTLAKHRHARSLPVVGHLLDDRVPGTAVRAGDEGVAVAPVGGVEQLRPTAVAHGHVGRHGQGRGTGGLALDDPEGAQAFGRNGLDLHPVHPGHDGPLPPEGSDEAPEPPLRALGEDRDLARLVPHPARDAMLYGDTVDVGTEADALHHAPHSNPKRPVPVRGARRI